MSGNPEVKRPVWVVPVTAFLIGLLIGWWVIGWWLWPVQWTNALPVDLRAAERDQYLMMVAESFAASGNADQARDRLKWWSADKLAKYLADLQERVGANTPQAAQVKALAELMGVSQPAAAGPQVPAPTTGRPEATSGPGPSLVAVLRSIVTVLLWLLLFVAALVIVYLLWAKWRKAYQGPRPAAIDVTARSGRTPAVTQRTLDEIAAEGKGRWIGEEVAETTGADIWEPVAGIDQEGPAPQPTPTAPAVGVKPIVPGGVTPPSSPATARPQPGRPAGRVITFRALYQMGEAGYDEGFDINDARGEYLGQCGLALNDPVGRSHDQAAALQAWLWDQRDPDTKLKVLMSEGAYRDTAMREQLKGEHEAIPVRAGTEFTLETHTLILHGTVERVEYADVDPPFTIFAELMVRFQVAQKA